MPDEPASYASPPCYAAEIAPDYFDPLAVDPQQARDVARWRKAERTRLLEARKALSVEARRSWGLALMDHLRVLLPQVPGWGPGTVFSAYWPIKGEADLRPLMTELHQQGIARSHKLRRARSQLLAHVRPCYARSHACEEREGKCSGGKAHQIVLGLVC